jgi:hypothetical protein
MRLLNASRPRSTGKKNDKALVSDATRIQKSCTTLQDELAGILDRNKIRKSELSEVFGRIDMMDRTASLVIKTFR